MEAQELKGKTAILYARASTQAQENKIQIDDLQLVGGIKVAHI